ncbi:hypothetical protein [Primorskyibacter sp. 2E233]|uniref:hypothetical protein n=1 Tax=Primorskyibacter sp. 2E233 TaxID=3413431 RepID=UPI003BF43AE2
MNRFLDNAVHGVARDAQDGARKLLVTTLLALSGWLIGAAGFGLLAAWAFLMLSQSVGPSTAALLLGLGLMALAAALLAYVHKRMSHPAEPKGGKTPEPAPETNPPDAASLFAFTAAYVLGRALSGDKRD